MDDLDRKLLCALSKNVRISISQLARVLGVSRSTAQSRLKRLETNGMIIGYRIEYGEKFNRNLIKAHVQIQVDQKLTRRTLSEIDKIGEVRAVYAVSGDYDLIAVLAAESTEKLSATLDGLANLEGVERTNSLVVLETKFVR
jgi:DNA-binding Lrp family transcriptional regulator